MVSRIQRSDRFGRVQRARRLFVCLTIAILVSTILQSLPAYATGSLTSTSWSVMDPRTGVAGNRYDWAFTNATSGTAMSRVTLGVPAGTTGPNKYLASSSTNNNQGVTTPTSGANNITGDIDVRVEANLPDWQTGSSTRILVAKRNSSAIRQYSLAINAINQMEWMWSNDGTNFTAFVVQAVPSTWANNTTHWMRVTFSVGTGTTKFWVSSNGTNWTQQGSDNVAGATSIHTTTANLAFGSYSDNFAPVNGKIYYGDVRSGISGTSTSPSGCNYTGGGSCFDPDDVPATISTGSNTWTSASTAHDVWTITRAGTNLPIDIASDLSVVSQTGFAAGGTASLRMLDGSVLYVPPSPPTFASPTALGVGVQGLTNTNSSGSPSSLVTTYNNNATPTAIDSATSNTVAMTVPIINADSGSLRGQGGAVTGTAINNSAPNGLGISGTHVYVTDNAGSQILDFDSTTGKATRLIGSGQFGSSLGGTTALAARMHQPGNSFVDASGNVYFIDLYNQLIRKYSASTGLVATVAGTSSYGYAGDNGPATTGTVAFNNPHGLVVNAAGDIFIADTSNSRVRKVDHSTLNIATVVGTGTAGYNGDNQDAGSAQVNFPSDLALDSGGNLFIADNGNHRVRRVDASTNIITTVAGTGGSGFSGDGGLATSATFSSAYSISFDTSDNFYISDTGDNRVRKVDHTTHFVSTIAGNGSSGFSGDGGSATSATFYNLGSLRVDSSGNVFVVDTNNFRVREVSAGGIVTTVFGNASVPSGDGNGVQAAYYQPTTMTSDAKGNTYIVDASANAIRKRDQWGNVTTIVNQSNLGGFGGDSGPAAAAIISQPHQVAVASDGTLYLADTSNNRIRKVDTSGNITSFWVGGAAQPYGIAVNPVTGDIWFTTTNCLLEKLTPAGGTATVLAGTAGSCAIAGDGGLATAATLASPTAMVFDASGDAYFIDGTRIRKYNAANLNMYTVAGGGAGTADNTPATSWTLAPTSLTIDNLGRLYVMSSAKILRFVDGGPVQTIAGNGSSIYAGDGGAATSASLGYSYGLAITQGQLLLSDQSSGVVRKVIDVGPAAPLVAADAVSVAQNTAVVVPVESNDWSQLGEMDPNSVAIATPPTTGTATVNITTGSTTTITYTPPANVSSGTDNFTYRACDSTLIACTTATVNVALGGSAVTTVAGGLAEAKGLLVGMNPTHVVRSHNYIYVSDSAFNVVRRYDIYSKDMTVVAGNGATANPSVPSTLGDGGPATAGSLNTPYALAFGPDGSLYIADVGDNRIRSVSPAGIITTVAGTGVAGYTGDTGTATNATLDAPAAIAFDSTGNMFVATHYSVREINPAGIISTVAGTGVSGSSGDTGPATAAKFTNINGIAINSSGAIYVADAGNCAVRKFTVGSTVTTVGGVLGSCGTAADGVATTTTLNNPVDVQVDTSNNVWVTEGSGARVRRFSDGGSFVTAAGTGTSGSTGDTGQATVATLRSPQSIALGPSGDFWIADVGNARVRYVAVGGIINSTIASGDDSMGGLGSSAATTQLHDSTNHSKTGVGLAVASNGDIFFGGNSGKVVKFDHTTGLSAGITSSNSIILGAAVDPNSLFNFTNQSSVVYRWNANNSQTLVAGSGTAGYNGDGISAVTAQLNLPHGIAFNSLGDLFIADENNNRIRRVDHSTGLISTVAGNGTASSTGDGGLAIAATLNKPSYVAVDALGDIYIAESAGNRIRMVDPAGYITTIAGNGTASTTGDGGLATASTINDPEGLSVDSLGNVFIAEAPGNVIREISNTGVITSVVGNGTSSYVDNTTTAAAARTSSPEGVSVRPGTGDVYFFDGSAHRIRKIAAAGSGATNAIASATWSIAPPATGHANIRYELRLTPGASSVSSKLVAQLPPGVTGTPVVVNQFGISGTASASLSGQSLTITYPSQTFAPGVTIGVAVEGFGATGTTGVSLVSANVYDSLGTNVIGTAPANVVKLSGSGVPAATDPGFGALWARSLVATRSSAAATIALSPLGATTSAMTLNIGGSGVLNNNTLSVSSSTLTSTAGTLAPVSTSSASGSTLGAFPVNRWGYALTSTSGTVATNLVAGQYVGSSTTPDPVVTAQTNAAVVGVTFFAKINYLTPAGQYSGTFTARLTPGS